MCVCACLCVCVTMCYYLLLWPKMFGFLQFPDNVSVKQLWSPLQLKTDMSNMWSSLYVCVCHQSLSWVTAPHEHLQNQCRADPPSCSWWFSSSSSSSSSSGSPCVPKGRSQCPETTSPSEVWPFVHQEVFLRWFVTTTTINNHQQLLSTINKHYNNH